LKAALPLDIRDIGRVASALQHALTSKWARLGLQILNPLFCSVVEQSAFQSVWSFFAASSCSREMPPLLNLDDSNTSKSRNVTLADIEWLVSPASQEIPASSYVLPSFASVADCLQQHAPEPPSEPHLHKAPKNYGATSKGKIVQYHGVRAGAASDSDTRDAAGLPVTNAFQRLMKKSKTWKDVKTEQR
jgi:hypothetical protein